MSSINAYPIKSEFQLQQFMEKIVDDDEIEPRVSGVLIELAQNMVSYGGGGTIYKNGVKIHAWHDGTQNKETVQKINKLVTEAEMDSPESLQGLGLYLMLQAGWRIRAFLRKGHMLVSLRVR